MSRVDAAAAMDRLPWLADEPRPQPARQRRGGVLLFAGVAVLAVAAGGFWIGSRTIGREPQVAKRQAQTTVQLPAPRPPEPQVRIAPPPEVRLAPVPEVRPEVARELHIAAPHPVKSEKGEGSELSHEQQAPAAAGAETQPSHTAQATAPPKPFVLPRPWPPRVIDGAAGRLVQVGAFGSTRQAKRGWWFMVRAYPAMAHLPAVVRPTRNSKGRIFYRFQVGTTSQAHSEVLCQRMLKIGLSCAVVGLPWKAKVER